MHRLHRRELVLVIALLAVSVSFAAYIWYHESEDRTEAYPLLSPSLSTLTVDEFLAYQSSVRVSYRALRTDFLEILNTTNSSYSIFFEDLRSGATVGIDERTEYLPKSLFKVPTAVAVLKAVEEGELDLDSTVTIAPEMLDQTFGTLYIRGAGTRITVAELLRLSLAESDNTANNALRSTVPFERIEEARLAMGVPYPQPNVTIYMISPKSYASVMRSLYLSGYLRRPYSQYTLELLGDSVHTEYIAAGVPQGIPVAHKIGEDVPTGEYHDCGIVYHPERPYILCIMSRSSTRLEAQRIIPALSKAAYEQASRPQAHLQKG